MKHRHVIRHSFKVHHRGHFGDLKNDLVACAGEFIGTVLFLLFGMGAVQTTSAVLLEEGGQTASARLEAYYYISAAFGLSLFAMASVFYRFTGSIFNPSVSLALVLTGVITPLRFLLVGLAQMVGGIVAAAILDALTPGGLIANVALSGGTTPVQGMFIEMFTTAALTISVLMLAAEKHLMTPMAPLGFGFTLWVVMLFSVQYTGGAVNTARAFGPAVIQGFQTYQWIYWVGPTLGALLATAFYIFLKYIKYWQVNPNQDSTNYVDGPMLEVVDAETGSIRTVRTSQTAHTGEPVPVARVVSNASVVPSVRTTSNTQDMV